LKNNFLIFFVFLLPCLSSLETRAQGGNLEFVENKGQWDTAIQFRADMPNVNFFLQKHGFSVLLQSPADMSALGQWMHGGTAPASGAGSSAKKSSTLSTSAFRAQAQTVPGNTGSGGGLTNPAGGSANGAAPKTLIMHSHLYQVEFLNSSPTVEISGDKALDSYNNYFIGNDSTKWRPSCKIYQAVVYKNLYPGIDLRYYTENGQLKYDLVVHPGASPDNIVLQYKGADKLIVQSGKLTIHTSVGDVQENIPRAYESSKEGNQDLECTYASGPNHTVRFHVSNYSPAATLIIDPTLVFSTFTGSRSDNWGYTATYDESGNFYSGSITLNSAGSGNGFLVSPGAFQTSFTGGDGSDGGFEYDITIMKFSSNGVNRLYATYLGGSGNEQPHSLVVDATGNLVIAGRTSSTDYPTKTGNGIADQNKGGYDIVLTKLNASGTALIGSRMIGGSGNDGVNIAPKYSSNIVSMGEHSLRLNYGDDGRSEVTLDAAGNVYLASCTSSTDFPLVNAFQKTPGGMQDGVFIKTSPTLSTILASTYLGGRSDDAAFALAIDPQTNNVYIGGGTSSTNFPGTANGPVIQSANSGGIDGFLAEVSGDGGTLIKTSYFGTTGTEVIYGVQFDNVGFPYIMGTTTGSWPVINAAFSQKNGKQFIAKLKPDISAYVYSTVFGKGDVSPDISPTAFLVDRCQNVYVAGWGGGIEREEDVYTNPPTDAVYANSTTNGLTVTPDAIKSTTDGSDFYFFVMKKDAASQLYGSFFGQNGGLGDHVDGGTSRFDKQGVIYEAICANCYGLGAFPTTPNVWSPKNGTGTNGCNLAAVKIAFNFAGVAADPKPFINGVYDSSGCVPLDVLFKDTIHNAKMYVWSFGDETPDTTTTVPQVDHIYTAIGNYTVRLIAIDSTTCNISDTAYLHIRVRTDRAILNFDIAKQPPCQSLSYIFTNISTPPAGKTFKPGDFSWAFGDGSTAPGDLIVPHTYQASGTYVVQLILSDTNFCNSPDTLSQQLRVSPVVKAQFDVPDGCAPYEAFITNTSLAGQQFLWTFDDGSTSTDVNPIHNYPDTGRFPITLLAIDSNTCNISDQITKYVEVRPKPTAAFTFLPLPAEYNTPTVFTNGSQGATEFVWLFGDGDSTIKNTTDTVVHQFEQTNKYNVCLVAINQYNCSDTVCHPVESLINPLLDVPNAFTPGRFGENGIIMVKGFGIASMAWKIYNRWGQLVFESNNPFIGWDGTYRGVPQPIGVYAYTLQATFFDGTKTGKKGDITLIR
jgi:gliding motility-associated-like protein